MEDSSFKSVRKGLIALCLLIISLFLLKIEITDSKLSLPFLGGAKIQEPFWIFRIIYIFFIYYSWKYYQYMMHEHTEGNLIEKAKQNFVNTYGRFHTSQARLIATQELGHENVTSDISYEAKNGFVATFTCYYIDPRTRNRFPYAVDLKIPFYKHLLHYMFSNPEFTILFLPIILWFFVIFVVLFPKWDGGLSLWPYIINS
ncbi:hypothetical protein JMN32_05095 [Fulvivirga sp. 29W222]|uniref:Uncharacterized protein n=1 Tax=Fulvivirga marina TaxID=2494733 RepID=A0A937FWA8_9BACT|nr:hypothetical protein [Fulvivirga marina]MBL6445673.1 hypothetical protein [Fulvivirga marina]